MMRWLLPVVALCAACDERLPAQIEADVMPVYLGIRSINPDLDPVDFNMQLFNAGDETLVIESVTVTGDANCSFTFDDPDTMEVVSGGQAFMRGSWAPSVAGEEHLVMDIVSNAEEFPTLSIPICALAVPEGTTDAVDLELCDVDVARAAGDCGS